MALSEPLSPGRRKVIEEARRWVGTPFRHQARVMGVGVDCGQLVIAVGEAAGVMRIDPVAWRPYAVYGRAPNPARMRRCLETFMHEIAPAEALPADVVWCAWRPDLPMHVAVLSEHKGRTTMVHALGDIGRVVEHGFCAEWPGRADSYWRYPGLRHEGVASAAQAGPCDEGAASAAQAGPCDEGAASAAQAGPCDEGVGACHAEAPNGAKAG